MLNGQLLPAYANPQVNRQTGRNYIGFVFRRLERSARDGHLTTRGSGTGGLAITEIRGRGGIVLGALHIASAADFVKSGGDQAERFGVGEVLFIQNTAIEGL